MATASSVTADWTFHNERRLAKPDVMLISGAFTADDQKLAERENPVATPVQVASAEDPNQVARGTCYCGKVKLELPLSLQPIMSVICHCGDCREWLSASSVAMILLPLERSQEDNKVRIPLNILSPTTDLTYVQRTPEVRRYFATCCGTRLFNLITNPRLAFEVCSTYQTLFPTYESQPAMHVHMRENQVLSRGIDEWMDLPPEFGGTGTKPE